MSIKKENIDEYLNSLAKEYKRINGKNVPAEIVIVGGASIVINYGFRDFTYDIDAIYTAGSAMKDAIRAVTDKYGLPDDWINNDFVKTSSYSNTLIEISKYYKEFSHILQVRTIRGEYLLAMKLNSGRPYKHDISDIIGILNEHIGNGNPITLEQLEEAHNKLYGKPLNRENEVFLAIKDFIGTDKANYEAFEDIIKQEKLARETLICFEKEYPNVLNEENMQAILKNRLQRESSLDSKLAATKEKVDSQKVEFGSRETGDKER